MPREALGMIDLRAGFVQLDLRPDRPARGVSIGAQRGEIMATVGNDILPFFQRAAASGMPLGKSHPPQRAPQRRGRYLEVLFREPGW